MRDGRLPRCLVRRCLAAVWVAWHLSGLEPWLSFVLCHRLWPAACAPFRSEGERLLLCQFLRAAAGRRQAALPLVVRDGSSLERGWSLRHDRLAPAGPLIRRQVKFFKSHAGLILLFGGLEEIVLGNITSLELTFLASWLLDIILFCRGLADL